MVFCQLSGEFKRDLKFIVVDFNTANLASYYKAPTGADKIILEITTK